jgi:hypothetical protein
MGGNLKISFREFITEGGNVAVGDIQAQAIDLSKIQRKEIVKIVIDGLLDLNKRFEKKYGSPLWSKDSYVKSGKVFSGSSEHFVNLNIEDSEFAKYKNSVGDIDVQVPDILEDKLSEFLTEGSKAGKMKYIGRSKNAIGQISSLYAVDFKPPINIQVDFEFVPFQEMGLPTDWARFSHSSNWGDIVEGIKGAFHKYLVGSIDFAFKDSITVLKGKKRKPTKTTIHNLAFSVHKGLRKKYTLAKTDDGKQIFVGKEPAFLELTPKESKYITDIQSIFEMLFKVDPSKKDMQMFDSFVGIISLLKKYMKKKQVQDIFDEFIVKIWGKGGQKMYRNDPLKDLEQKSIAFNYFKKQLNVKSKDADKLKQEYYDKY